MTAAASVNVLNLVEGEEALVESPDGAFEPFVVHYAETFIVPAAAGPFTLRPHGPSVRAANARPSRPVSGSSRGKNSRDSAAAQWYFS